MHEPAESQMGPEPKGGALAALSVAVITFALMAPTLSWSEFEYGVEKLNVATALELRRAAMAEGRIHWRTWLVPTLEGESRIRKPPMNAWITALVVRPETVKAMSDPDPAVRERAFRQLAWQTRWPALAYACAALIGVYVLGRIVADPATGLAAACVAASTLYFVRFNRLALTDVPLFFWVTWANVFVALAVIRRRVWIGCIGAGLCLGFAMMNKGPVGLVQSVLPVLAFAAWWGRGGTSQPDRAPPRRAIAPAIAPAIAAGLLLFLVVGGAWFAFVAARNPGTLDVWRMEVLRSDEAEKATGTRLDYLSIFGFMMPWTVFFVGGLMEGVRRLRRKAAPAGAGDANLVLMFFMILVPLVVLSCFRDRKERYLLPLLAPAAVMTAQSLLAFLRQPRLAPIERIGGLVHWIVLLCVGPGLALIGAIPKLGLPKADGGPWLSIIVAVVIALFFVVFVAAAWAMSRRWRATLPIATLLVVLAAQAVWFYGYAHALSGMSEMKPLADLLLQQHPDVEPYNLKGDGRRRMAPNDLSIYLNRITRVVPEASDIAASNRPQVYTELWDRPDREPEPKPAEGWRFFARVPRGKGWWYAFIRTPT